MKKLKKKFLPAISGMIEGIKKDSSIQLQYLLGVLAISSAFFFRFTVFETVIVLLFIVLVIALEYINTALEIVCNEFTVKENENVRRVKDYASAAVLIVSLGALIVGLIFIFKHIS